MGSLVHYFSEVCLLLFYELPVHYTDGTGNLVRGCSRARGCSTHGYLILGFAEQNKNLNKF